MAILASCDQLEASKSIITDIPQHLNLIRNYVQYSSSLLRDLANSQNMDKPVIMTVEELQQSLIAFCPACISSPEVKPWWSLVLS